MPSRRADEYHLHRWQKFPAVYCRRCAHRQDPADEGVCSAPTATKRIAADPTSRRSATADGERAALVDAGHADYQGNIRFLLPARANAGQEEPALLNIPIDTFAVPMDDEMLLVSTELVRGLCPDRRRHRSTGDQKFNACRRCRSPRTPPEAMIRAGGSCAYAQRRRRLAGAGAGPVAVVLAVTGYRRREDDHSWSAAAAARWVARALRTVTFFVAFPFWLHPCALLR